MNAPVPPRPTRESAVAASGGSIHDFRKANRKMRWWYESLADYMIANPQATQNEIAAYFGRAVATISTIVNTDAFIAYFRQRRQQHAEGLDIAVRAKLFKIADASLDHMLAALEKKRDSVPIETLHRTTDMALKNLGYGAPAPSGVTVHVGPQPPTTVNVAVSLDDLERAREALRRNQQKIIDVTPEPESAGSWPAADPLEAPLAAPEPVRDSPALGRCGDQVTHEPVPNGREDE